ncbi:WD40-repeat-containing domain protein [Dichomitus squalens]|uniref:WD40-repeat-containing domain protein n=1 Tax=Dichomitus squalens TaxID=114155 RepID=A0A4Q9M888_9APHY|nr:WD40-repeat-containing domain protein [Dichomitus squalens]
MSASPRLPWEVIESIISYSGDHRTTLHSFSLTCRDLRPGSLCLMFAEVRHEFKETAEILAFRDFLNTSPHLRPLVRSIRTFRHAHLAFHLLRFLPNLTHITLEDRDIGYLHPACSLPQPVLACYRASGTHIEALNLYNTSFSNLQELCRLLLAFTGLQTLSCRLLETRSTMCTSAQLAQIQQRLSQQLRLRILEIDEYTGEVMARLLLESAPSAMESLTLSLWIKGTQVIPRGTRLPKLRILTIRIWRPSENVMKTAIEALKDIRSDCLADVTVQILSSPSSVVEHVRGDVDNLRLCSELDRILLAFPRPNLVLKSEALSIHPRRLKLWSEEFHGYFPNLASRGLLTIVSEPAPENVGHEDRVQCLAYFPDSKWLATASWDCTIILWDSDGQLVQEWIAHSGSVKSLAFSPDGQHLVSGGGDRRLVVWDVMPGIGTPKARILEEHTEELDRCAWSPDRTVIASRSKGGIVRLWDARTFQLLRLLDSSLKTDHRHDLLFSPDGRWLASIGSDGCCIVDIGGGTVHKVLQTETSSFTAAFDARSTRLATGAHGGVVRIWDVQTGEMLSASKRHMRAVLDVAFSSDGTRILSASEDKTVKICDASSGAMVLSLEGHTAPVNKACFSPCGEYVASVSADLTVRVWRTDDGSCIKALLEHKDPINAIAFSPDGKTLASGALNGTVVIRYMRDIVPVEGTDIPCGL